MDREAVKAIGFIVIITVMSQLMLLNNIAVGAMVLVCIFISAIMFFHLTKDVYNKTKEEQKIKNIFYIIILAISFFTMNATCSFIIYYIIAFLVKRLDDIDVFDTPKKFIGINIIIFVILGILSRLINIENMTTMGQGIYMYSAFIINCIIFSYFISKKINVTNKRILYIISTVFIVVLVGVNSIKIYDMIKILKTEEKIITILETSKDKINNKDTIIELKEAIGEDNASMKNVKNGYFLDNASYRETYYTMMELIHSDLDFFIEKYRTVKITDVKEELNNLYNIFQTKHEYIGKTVLVNMIISPILNVGCITIILLVQRKQKECVENKKQDICFYN